MSIIIVWGVGVARLIFTLLGVLALQTFRSGVFLVTISVLSVALGVVAGGIVYAWWPEAAKARDFSPALSSLQAFPFALPLFYLTWPLMARYAWQLIALCLVVTLLPLCGRFPWRRLLIHRTKDSRMRVQ